MESCIATLQKNTAGHLEDAALGYLSVALDRKRFFCTTIQVTVGILGIAIELMLKSLIARHSLTLLYKDLPLALRTFFAAPEKAPCDSEWQRHDIDLRSGAFKTLELHECISVFYLLFPRMKPQLQSHLKFLTGSRNAALHSIFPHFHAYELDRTRYVALKLYELLMELKGKDAWTVTVRCPVDPKRAANWISEFEKGRVDRVHKSLAAAKQKAKTIATSVELDPKDCDWDEYVAQCPICKNDARLTGDTVFVPDFDRDGTPEGGHLEFQGASFECYACGLKLNDPDEMHLAGVDTGYDRSDEMDAWAEAYYEYPY